MVRTTFPHTVSWAAAQPGVDAPPDARAPLPLRMPPIAVQTLPNGLRVVVVEQHRMPLVTVACMFDAGDERDPAERAGLARLGAALLTKGVQREGRTLDAAQLAREAEALGGTLESGSGWGRTRVSTTVTTPNAPRAVSLLAAVVRRPLLPADALEIDRGQQLDALRQALGQPRRVADMALRRSFWGASPYGASPTAETLGRIRREDVAAFHAAIADPSRMTLVLAGDMTPADGRALAQQAFGDWQRRSGAAVAASPAVVATAPSATPPLLLVDMPGSGQSEVAIALPFVPASSAERIVGIVAQAVVGRGYSSRLNQSIRIRRGLSYGVGSELDVHPEAGMFGAGAQTNHPTAVQVLALMREEMQRLATEPPDAAELAARSATVSGAFARSLETTQGLAALVMTEWAQGRPLRDLATFDEQVRAVTSAQVAAFARTHWASPQALRAVIAGDLKAAGATLDALGPAPRIPLDRLDPSRSTLP